VKTKKELREEYEENNFIFTVLSELKKNDEKKTQY